MNVEDSLYHAVHDYHGGATSLAPRMGLAPSTLSNMADPKQPGHAWPLRRFRDLLMLTGDMRPLDALCAENGGVFVPTAKFGGVSDVALLETVTKLGAGFGDVLKTLNEALKDGDIVPAEFDSIQQHIYEMNQAGAELMNRAAQLVKRRGA